MITEDYVSFETAKLLKEKGFTSYYGLYSYMENGGTKVTHWDNELNLYPKPTLQMAMKWLREKHKLYIEVTLCIDGEHSTFNVMSLNDNVPYDMSIEYQLSLKFNTYEDACEAAIKYCLENLI